MYDIRELALSLLYWACRLTTVEKRAAAGTTGQRGGANTPTLKAGLQLQVGGAVHCREPEPGSWCRLTSGRRLCVHLLSPSLSLSIYWHAVWYAARAAFVSGGYLPAPVRGTYYCKRNNRPRLACNCFVLPRKPRTVLTNRARRVVALGLTLIHHRDKQQRNCAHLRLAPDLQHTGRGGSSTTSASRRPSVGLDQCMGGAVDGQPAEPAH